MQAVLSNLIGSEQNFTVEDGIIQDNIHLARLIIEQNLLEMKRAITLFWLRRSPEDHVTAGE